MAFWIRLPGFSPPVRVWGFGWLVKQVRLGVRRGNATVLIPLRRHHLNPASFRQPQRVPEPRLYSAVDASTVRQMPLQCGRCLYSAADTSTVRQMPLQCGRCLYSAVGGTFRPSVFWRAGLLTDKLPNIFAILFIRGFPFCLGPLLSWNFFLPAVLFFLKYKRGETGKTGNVPLYQETEQRAKHQER